MIEVILYRSDQVRSRVFDIEDWDSAVFVARTLWDDDRREHMVQGAERARRVDFLKDGTHVLTINGRRP